MKKILIVFLILIMIVFGSIYGVLFTSSGNGFIASYIEDKVNDGQDKVKLKVENLKLTFNTIDFKATIDDNSKIDISGDLAIFKKRVDLSYDIKIKELAYLEELISQKLNGPFSTRGTFKGNEKFATIQGISDFAKSNTQYKVNLVEFDVRTIDFTIKNAYVSSLLHMLNQADYSKGILNASGKIKNAEVGFLDGYVNLYVKKGKLNNKVINKEFKQNLQTKIYFNSSAKAKLQGDIVTVKSDLITSIADVFTNESKIDLRDSSVNSDYKIDFKNLSKLQSVIGKKINGHFKTFGNFTFKNGKINIDGKSDILSSNTNYSLKVENSILKLINFNINKAKLDKLFHMIDNPVYARGDLNIEGNIRNRDENVLYGSIVTNISNGKVINEVVNSIFKKNLKNKILFNGNINSKLDNNKIVSTTKLTTTMADFSSSNSVFDIKKASFKSDYLLKIPSLLKLRDVTGVKLRGAVDLRGNVVSKAKYLGVDGSSKILGGDLKFKLKNNDFDASLNSMEIKDLTYMLYYPKIFNSNGDFKLDYNLLLKRGKLEGILNNGHFLPNNFSNMINQFSKFDLTREVYKKTTIKSDINDMVLKSDISMISKNSTINVNKSILNLKKENIDAKVDVKIKKIDFSVKVKGKTSNPKISLDAKNLLKNEAKKKLNKYENKIEEKLNKVLKGKVGEDGAKNILNNIKSLF